MAIVILIDELDFLNALGQKAVLRAYGGKAHIAHFSAIPNGTFTVHLYNARRTVDCEVVRVEDNLVLYRRLK